MWRKYYLFLLLCGWGMSPEKMDEKNTCSAQLSAWKLWVKPLSSKICMCVFICSDMYPWPICLIFIWTCPNLFKRHQVPVSATESLVNRKSPSSLHWPVGHNPISGWWWLEPWNFEWLSRNSWEWNVIIPTDELHHFSRWLLHHQPDVLSSKLSFLLLTSSFLHV